MCNSVINRNRIVTVAAALTASLLLCGFNVENEIAERSPRTPDYEVTEVYADGILTDGVGYSFGTDTFVTPETFFRILDIEYEEIKQETDCPLVFSFDGNVVSLDSERNCMMLGERVLPAEEIKTIGGEICLSVSDLARLIGAETTWDDATESVDINATCLVPVVSTEDYYNEEDLYWLSRIIQAEAGSEELEGMVAVGNVVLNRVAVDAYPDTVCGVIFDTNYGIQFSPVESGSIYCEPGEDAVTAAKLCLEGCSVAGDSLYFVNPSVGLTSWFDATREFVASIGGHDFYA